MALLYVRKRVQKFKPKRYEIGEGFKAVTWAKTRNNQREVNYFRDLMEKQGFSLDVYNMADSEGINFSVRINDIWPFFEMFFEKFKENNSVNVSLFHQQLMYVFSYIEFLYSLSAAGTVKLALLANDHSPIPVAFSCAAKCMGIERLYIQHAEVANTFPPLNFEYVLLRNYRSLEIYRSLGKVTGKVQILSRRSDIFNYEGLKESVAEGVGVNVDVVVFLTAIYNIEYLIKLVEALKKNDGIASVFVQPHPSISVPEKQNLAESGLCLIDRVGENKTIAIVGNSSVVTELLFRGIPVFQDFKLDDVGVDYYGYVSNKLAFEFSFEMADTVFWKNAVYDEAWLNRYSDIEPSVGTIRNNALASTKEEFLYRVLMCVGLVDYDEWMNTRKWCTFKNYMFFLTKTYLDYDGKNQRQVMGAADVLRFCEAAFSRRLPEMINIISKADFQECNTVLKIWLYLKRVEWTGHSPDYSVLKDVVDYITLEKYEKFVLAKLEGMLLSVLIRYKEYNLLNSFFSKARYVNINKLHIHKRIAMNALDFSKISVVDLSERFLVQGLSDFHKLKFHVQTGSCSASGDTSCSHDVLVQKFIDLSPKTVSQDFRTEVMPRYKAIKHRMVYMNIRSSKSERDAVLGLICDCVVARKSFAMIRMSDGEAYFFLEKLKYWSEEDARNRERHWWGEEISSVMRREISSSLYDSLYDVDLIGLPSMYRFIRDCTDSSVSLSSSLTGRGILEVVHGVSEMPLSASFTEDKANLILFADLQSIKAISKNANRVVFIGSASDDYMHRFFSELNSFLYIPVPTHFKTRSNAKYYSGDQSLPYKYKDVIEKIRANVTVGDVVFVAAGVIGKLFVVHSKYKGAVALDVGSALDQLADANIHSLH